MEKAFDIAFQSYTSLLDELEIPYQQDDLWAYVGTEKMDHKWWLFITCTSLQAPHLLDEILPILKREEVCFCLIKDQLKHYLLNSGGYGPNLVGKVIAIIPASIDKAKALLAEMEPITDGYKGPVIPDALRIAENIYCLYAEPKDPDLSSEILKLYLPKPRYIPFVIPPAYRKKRKKNIIGKRYIAIDYLRLTPKGNIIKAIDIKKLELCLIKQGKPAALDDHFGREMKDRLLWQKEVITAITPEIPTAQVRNFFMEDSHANLVLDFLNGESYGSIIKRTLTTDWKDLNAESRVYLLETFLNAVKLIEAFHAKGFVHRDITDSNFLVDTKGKMHLLDFEVSYSMEDRKPSPPFVLGTRGYIAPEQIQYAMPDFKEDIFSLGALLCFTLTGKNPWDFLEGNLDQEMKTLLALTENKSLTGLVESCLHTIPQLRPEIQIIQQIIKEQLYEILLHS